MFTLFLLAIIVPPIDFENSIIIGKTQTENNDVIVYFDEDGKRIKSENIGDEKIKGNTLVFLIEEEYCGSQKPWYELIKNSSQKVVTKSDGEFWLYAEPHIKYRIYYVVGTEYRYKEIEPKPGINDVGMHTLYIYNYKEEILLDEPVTR